jgi:hypothetical protein
MSARVVGLLTAAVIASWAPNLSAEQAASDPMNPGLSKHLDTIAGRGATHCGYVGENSPQIDEAVACVKDAYAKRHAFTFAFGSNTMWFAYAWSGKGSVTQVIDIGGVKQEGPCAAFEVASSSTVHCSI